MYYQTYYNGLITNYTISRYKKTLDKFGQELLITSPQLIKNYELKATQEYIDTHIDSLGNKVNNTEVLIPIPSKDANTLVGQLVKQLIYFNNIVYDLDNYENISNTLNNTNIYNFKHFCLTDLDNVENVGGKSVDLYSVTSHTNQRLKSNTSLYEYETLVLLDKVPYLVNIDMPEVLSILENDEEKEYARIFFNSNINMALKLNSSDLLPNESREEIILGDVYTYINSKGERVKANEAIDFSNNTIKDGYKREVISVLKLITDKIVKSAKEFEEFILKQCKYHTNYFEYHLADKDNKVKLSDNKVLKYSISTRNNDLFLCPNRCSDKKLYEVTNTFFKENFLYPSPSKYSRYDFNILYPENTVFVIGNLNNKKRNNTLDHDGIDYKIDKIQLSKKSYDTIKLSSKHIIKIDNKDYNILDVIKNDAKDYNLLMYEEVKETKTSKVTKVLDNDDITLYYNTLRYYNTVKYYNFNRFFGNKIVLCINYGKRDDLINRSDLTKELDLYQSLDNKQFWDKYEVLSLSNTAFNKLLTLYNKDTSKDKLRLVEVGSNEYYDILSKDENIMELIIAKEWKLIKNELNNLITLNSLNNTVSSNVYNEAIKFGYKLIEEDKDNYVSNKLPYTDNISEHISIQCLKDICKIDYTNDIKKLNIIKDNLYKAHLEFSFEKIYNKVIN